MSTRLWLAAVALAGILGGVLGGLGGWGLRTVSTSDLLLRTFAAYVCERVEENRKAQGIIDEATTTIRKGQGHGSKKTY